MAVGSTWDPALVRQLGDVLAAEARSKNVHVLLGPTVCIVRTPLAGRTFESFSEDPLLTARIAGAYIEGVQAGGVACCIKHFACNDQEHERMTISAEVDERSLREIHLVAFEHAVREVGVWSVMTAYNKVNGVYCGEQPDLISGVLRREWGFDGLVMSDWFGTHSTVPAALAGLDLEMPGPSAWLGPSLAAAVRTGEVDESVVDGQVRNVLRLMAGVGILGGTTERDEEESDDPGAGAPWLAGWRPKGPCSWSTTACCRWTRTDRRQRRRDRPQRGAAGNGRRQFRGDATPAPAGRRGAGGAAAGGLGRVRGGLPDRPGLSGRSTCVCSPTRRCGSSTSTTRTSPAPRWRRSRRTPPACCGSGRPQPDLTIGACSVRLSATFVPDVAGAWRLGLESAGRAVLRLNGEVVVDNSDPGRGSSFYGAGSEPVEVTFDLAAGASYELAVDIWPRSASSPIMGVRIGAAPRTPATSSSGRSPPPREPTWRWWSSAPTDWESEGHDRPDLSLPGRQRELVEAVLEVNPRTVVVVNAGSPVDMPWAARAGAVLLTWYPARRAPTRWPTCWSAWRNRRAAAGDVPGPGGGRAGGPGCGGRAVSGRRGQGRVRRRRPGGLPLLRDLALGRPSSPSASGSPTATSRSSAWRGSDAAASRSR